MGSHRASLIIRCYNEADYLGKLLHGLEAQTMQDFEIILVDSGSTDGTLEIAESFGVDEIIYIDPENFSFGRALNYGCEAATGEYCVIASAHVYPRRDDWLERLLEKFEEDVALVYGKQRGNDVTTFSENQIFKQWFPDRDIDRQSHPFCNNANAAIKRNLWEQYTYDETLTGLEDVDWAKRVQKDGYDISYASEAEIVHVHDETAQEVFNRYRREAYAHRQIMPSQTFSLLDFLRLSATNVLSDYRAAREEGVLLSNLLEIPKFRLLQFWGTYRGFGKDGPISNRLWQRFYYPNRESYPSTNRDGVESDPSINRDGEELPTDDDIDGNHIDYSDEAVYVDEDTDLDSLS
jgi:glycosyltransferase involved in cell wall biosynthesis